MALTRKIQMSSTRRDSGSTAARRYRGLALTKVMASEGGEHTILVNALLVGLIMSDQWVKRHAE